MSRFGSALGPAIGSLLLPPLWRLVDDYRDLLWGCVATSRYEDGRSLELCLRGLATIADGLLINFSATTSLLLYENEEKNTEGIETTDGAVIRKKVLALCLRSGFRSDNIVLPATGGDEQKGGYDVQMNQLLDKFDSRAHYFIEVQSREVLKCVAKESVAKILYEMRDKKCQSDHPVALTKPGFREQIFASDPLTPSGWRCLYPAHSLIRAKTNQPPTHLMQVDIKELVIRCCIKRDEQLEWEATALENHAENKDNTFAATRNRFYAGENYRVLAMKSLVATDAEARASKAYKRVSDEIIRYAPNAWSTQQMAYVANWRLIELMRREAHGEAGGAEDKLRRMTAAAIRAQACDPQRYEALLELLEGSREMMERKELEQQTAREAVYYAAQQFKWIDASDPANARLEFVNPPRPIADFTLFGEPTVTQFKLLWSFVTGLAPSIQFLYAAANTLLKNILADPKWIQNHRDLRCFLDATIRAHNRCFPSPGQRQLPPHVLQATAILEQPAPNPPSTS